MTPTGFPFTLPVGLVDADGQVHREGLMRRATVFDELDAQLDPRAQTHDAWLGLLLLSRVVVRLGLYAPVSPALLGRLFATDYAHLQSLYLRLNTEQPAPLELACPSCAARLAVQGG